MNDKNKRDNKKETLDLCKIELTYLSLLFEVLHFIILLIENLNSEY